MLIELEQARREGMCEKERKKKELMGRYGTIEWGSILGVHTSRINLLANKQTNKQRGLGIVQGGVFCNSVGSLGSRGITRAIKSPP